MGQGRLIIEDSWSYSDTPQSVWLLWTSYLPYAETSTWQHTSLTTDKHPCSRRDSKTQSQQTQTNALDRAATGTGDFTYGYTYIFLPKDHIPSISSFFIWLSCSVSDGYTSYSHAVISSILILPSRSRSKDLPQHTVLKHPKPTSLLFTNSYMRHGVQSDKILNLCIPFSVRDQVSRPYTRGKKSCRT